MRKVWCLAILGVVLTLPANAASYVTLVSDTGIFSDPNDVYQRTFVYLDKYASVLIQTWGYGGGTNAAGFTVPSGGFDPVVALWSGTGASAVLIGTNDDGLCPPGNESPTCADSTLEVFGLSTGTYTVTLTAYNNLPVGGTLGLGFTNGGSYIDKNSLLRTTGYAVDVLGTPEPVTLLLTGAGLVLFGIVRRRRVR